MNRLRPARAWMAAVALGAAFLAPQSVSYADQMILNQTFSGNTVDGTLTATFTDVTGGVQLVLTSNLTNPSSGEAEYVSEWDFNFNPSLTLSDLTITGQSGALADATPPPLDSVNTGTDAFKADGTGGFFDISFVWDQSNKLFHAGSTATYMITYSGSGTFNAASFNYTSTAGGDFYSAAHVQGVGANASGSGWIAPSGSPSPPVPPIPEPSTIVTALSGFGMLGLVASRRRSRRTKVANA